MTNGSNFCGPGDITKIFIVEPQGAVGIITASTLTVDGNATINGDIFNCGSGSTIYTENIYPCDSGVTISNIVTFYPNPRMEPTSDDLVTVGSPSRRFRDVNTVSGTSTVWTSTIQVITPNLNLGLDTDSIQRTITADNSIIQDDTLMGGIY